MVACATAAAKVIKEPGTLSRHLLSCYQTTSWKRSGYNSSPIQAQTRQLQQRGCSMSTYRQKALTDNKSGQKDGKKSRNCMKVKSVVRMSQKSKDKFNPSSHLL